MAEKQWRWIGADGFEYTGSLETLGTALRDGRASPTSMVSGPTMDGWLPASDVPELALAEASLPAFRVEDDAPTMRDNPLPESLEPEPPAAEPEPAAARASSPRSSRISIVRPGTRNAVCRARARSASTSNSASLMKICRSAQ